MGDGGALVALHSLLPSSHKAHFPAGPSACLRASVPACLSGELAASLPLRIPGPGRAGVRWLAGWLVAPFYG